MIGYQQNTFYAHIFARSHQIAGMGVSQELLLFFIWGPQRSSQFNYSVTKISWYNTLGLSFNNLLVRSGSPLHQISEIDVIILGMYSVYSMCSGHDLRYLDRNFLASVINFIAQWTMWLGKSWCVTWHSVVWRHTRQKCGRLLTNLFYFHLYCFLTSSYRKCTSKTFLLW